MNPKDMLVEAERLTREGMLQLERQGCPTYHVWIAIGRVAETLRECRLMADRVEQISRESEQAGIGYGLETKTAAMGRAFPLPTSQESFTALGLAAPPPGDSRSQEDAPSAPPPSEGV